MSSEERREEIREDLATRFYNWEVINSGSNINWDAYKEDYFKYADDFLSYLHSQGVVIRVKMELPRYVMLEGGTFDILAEGQLAGCCFFEPLLEE